MSSRDECLMMTPELLLAECEQEFRKARGHGGQKVNKTSVAVRITHKVSGLTVSEGSSRSQRENRLHALQKLRQSMALKIRESSEKTIDFQLDPPPSVHNDKRYLWMARLLDVLADSGWELKSAAEKLDVSVSHLTKILYGDPLLWQELNHQREQAGLHGVKGC